MHGKVLELREDRQAKQQAEARDEQARHQQRPAVHSTDEADRRQIGQHEAGLASAFTHSRRRGLRLGGLAGGRFDLRCPRRAGRRHQGNKEKHGHQEAGHFYTHVHLTSLGHKDGDYTRKSLAGSPPGVPFTRSGRAIPPVRKIRMPSSTVMSGNIARDRSLTTMSPI